jgi:sugar O-acyltransferase (sialic acid O-acetyltransferase NeuD family)
MKAERNRTAYIIGSGGHSRVVESFLPRRRIRRLVERDAGPDDILQANFFAGEPDRDGDYFIAIGDNAVRRRYFDRLKAIGITVSSCIAPTAWIAGDAKLGAGIFVGAGAVIGAGASVGDNAMVNNLSLLDHDSVLGPDSQITVGVILGGTVTVGRNCYLAMRSCVAPGLAIGDDAFVMAGAVVVKPVPAGAKVGGVPARIIAAAPPSEGGPQA